MHTTQPHTPTNLAGFGRQVAHLNNGDQLDIRDRTYVQRTSGETVLSAVIATSGRVVAAIEVHHITWEQS